MSIKHIAPCDYSTQATTITKQRGLQ